MRKGGGVVAELANDFFCVFTLASLSNHVKMIAFFAHVLLRPYEPQVLHMSQHQLRKKFNSNEQC